MAKSSSAHERINKCNKCSYRSPLRKNLKYCNNRTYSGIKFQCNQFEIFFTGMSWLRAHIQLVYKTFQFVCNKCTFKGITHGYLDKHIIWILEGKWLQCELCHDKPTLKAAIEKHIEFIYDMDIEPNTKSHLAVYVFSVEKPMPPKWKLTNT